MYSSSVLSVVRTSTPYEYSVLRNDFPVIPGRAQVKKVSTQLAALPGCAQRWHWHWCCVDSRWTRGGLWESYCCCCCCALLCCEVGPVTPALSPLLSFPSSSISNIHSSSFDCRPERDDVPWLLTHHYRLGTSRQTGRQADLDFLPSPDHPVRCMGDRHLSHRSAHTAHFEFLILFPFASRQPSTRQVGWN